MLKIVSDEIKGFDSAAYPSRNITVEQKKHFEAKYEREQSREWRNGAVNSDIKLRLLTSVLDDIGDDSDLKTVQSELRKLSNFDEMERLIDDFSSQAPWIQLSNLLRFSEEWIRQPDRRIRTESRCVGEEKETPADLRERDSEPLG